MNSFRFIRFAKTDISQRSVWQRHEQGQSLVILAIFMLAFLGILGLVIDMGYGYARYRQMQTAADSAALAGVRELALGHGEVSALSRMEQILISNGASGVESEFEVTGNQTHVIARAIINPIFTPIFGLHQFQVGTRAEASFGQAVNVSSILPFAVEEDLWVLDQEANLWVGETGPGGNYGWVRWNGQSLGASILRANIDDPSNSGTLRIGDVVAGRPGISFSAVRTSLEAKIGQTINVFFYDPSEVAGAGANLRYTITGFGKFQVTEIQSRGVHSVIRGYFVQSVLLGGEMTPGPTRGIMTTGLTQ